MELLTHYRQREIVSKRHDLMKNQNSRGNPTNDEHYSLHSLVRHAV